MNILVIGSGGREHALVWKIAQSPRVKKIYCANGNAGIRSLAECIAIKPEDIHALADFAASHTIDLTVVGSETPLTLGIVDLFESRGLKIFGPSAKAAEIEGSKVFSKQLMKKYSIPTAAFETFDNADQARSWIRSYDKPCVVKTDGLAAGKGAIVCMSTSEALDAVDQIMSDKQFGSAGSQIVVEAFMEGEEASIFAVTDGTGYVVLPAAQDHKRALDGDLGKNTGGMGAYAPAPVATHVVIERTKKEIIEPTLAAMAHEGRTYKGVLYCGIMVTPDGPKVVEFNCRFGDPECQVLMMLISSDIVDLFQSVADNNLDPSAVTISDAHAACVVMASGGYPDAYAKGKIVNGLHTPLPENCAVFHAGTDWNENNIITNGGRVLGISATGADLKKALDTAYTVTREIHFENAFYRKDIGHRALKK